MAANDFAEALAELLKARAMPMEPTALCDALDANGESVHRGTLSKLLSGETARPRRTTIDAIARGLKASSIERRMLRQAAAGESAPRNLSVLEALGGIEELDRGRELEHYEVTHIVGDTDSGDRVVEVKHTHVGADGLTLASFGPGQLGQAGFPIEDVPRLRMQVEAERLIGDRTERIETFVHLLEVVPSQRQLRFVVQFSGVRPHERIRWSASYRWPGLWRSLREGGQSDARIGVNRPGRPAVPEATLVVVARESDFPDLQLTSLVGDPPITQRFELDRREERYRRLTLRQDAFPSELAFRLSSRVRGGGKRVV